MIAPVKINSVNIRPFSGILHKPEVKHAANTTVTEPILTPNGYYIQNEISLSNKRFEEFLNKKGKVSLEEYKKIKKEYPGMITKARLLNDRAMKEKNVSVTPKVSAKIISGLGHLIGQDTKIVSLGTSPSFITEGLKAIGADVVFIPISGACNCRSKDTINDYFEYYPNLKKVAEYLKYQGITPKNINRGTNVVLLDFVSTGRTLEITKRLVIEHCKIPAENVSVKNLKNFIEGALMRQSGIRQSSEERKSELFDIIFDIFEQKVEFMSNEPHFNVYRDSLNKKDSSYILAKHKSQEELFRAFEEFSKPSARAYQLCVLNELDIMGKIK